MRPLERVIEEGESLPSLPRGVTHGTTMRRQGVMTGPVRFRPPKGATPEELTQMQEYVDAANKALKDGKLSPTGRVKVTGELKDAKERAARAERVRAEKASEPYGDKVAAHLPDTTWAGTADPPGGWGRHTDRVNTSLGSQSGKYPEGYVPTGFEVEDP
jgi:hypothetical protein